MFIAFEGLTRRSVDLGLKLSESLLARSFKPEDT